jgi:hypothetical protein
VIPDEVINEAEGFLLQIAPIEINYLGKGHQSLKGAFQSIQSRSYETLNYLRGAGFAIVWAGCFLLIPGAGPATAGSAAVAAAALSYKTIVEGKPKKVAHFPKDNGADVEL